MRRLALALLARGLAVSPAVAQQTGGADRYLVQAMQAKALGDTARAKELVDQAAGVARLSQEWYDVANAYRSLGYEDAARQATQRGQEALKLPRRMQ